MSEQTQNNANEIQFQIQKVYIKDASLEIPNGSEAFKQEWKPELNVALNTTVNKLPEDNMFEVILTVETDVKCNDKPAFKVEVQQAGVFLIDNMEEKQLDHARYAFCPNILYPYAREAISSLVSRSGFPELHVAPVNFDMIYQQKQNEKNQTSAN